MLAGVLAAAPARADPVWPSHLVTLVVPFPPGGSTYFLARLLARRLSVELGQPFLLDVRAGNSGLGAITHTAAAAPDGYTLVLLPNSSYVMAPHVMPAEVNVARDLAPVGMVASASLVLCVYSDSGFNSMADLVAAARLAPGTIAYSSGGLGVSNHLGVELMAERMGVRFVHRPLAGMAAAMQAVLADEVTFSFLDLVPALASINSGALRPLAVSSSRRLAQLPEVPTVIEAGLAGFGITANFALFAPAGTPEPVLDRLAAAVIASMSTADARQLLLPLAIDPWPTSRAEFATSFAAEDVLWGDVAQRLRRNGR